MDFVLNQGQQRVVEAAVKWYTTSSKQVFQYSGSAGTGKSVVLNEIVKRLKIKKERILCVSYTGAAATVMRRKGLPNACTIHSAIYEPVTTVALDEMGKPKMDTYLNRPYTTTKWIRREFIKDIDLIVVDEAGMTPKDIARDLESYGVKIIACGDLNQLPPITGEPGYLAGYDDVYILDEIMRQAGDSGIIYLANRALAKKPIQPGVYNNAIVLRKSEINLEQCKNAEVILATTNKDRDRINQVMRKNFGIDSQFPVHGEPIICRRNNWSIQSDGISMVNGLRGRVYNYPDLSRMSKDRGLMIDFMADGNTLFKDLLIDMEYFKADMRMKDIIKNQRFRTEYNKFELAYGLTVHISQGSQFDNGIFYEGSIFSNRENLIYTAITRFANRMIYVLPDKFY